MKSRLTILAAAFLVLAVSCSKEKKEEEPTILSAPELSVAETTTDSFKVTWEAVEGAEKYGYEFEGNSDYVSETELSFSGLEAGATYSLKVKSVSASAESEWAEISVTLESDPGNPDGGSISGSMSPISLGCNEGDSNTLNLAFGGSWNIKSTSEWFTVTPDKGEKGTVKLNIEATEANPTIDGRVGELVVASGTNEKTWKIVQLGAKGFAITDQSTTYTSEVGEVVIQMTANTEEFTFESPENMVKSYEVRFYGDYEEIEGTGIYSDYRNAEVTVTLNRNPNMDSQRENTVKISAGIASEEITLIQPEGKWDTPFYRKSLFMDFTSTGCQFCPYMAEAIEEATAAYPDRIVPVGCYSTALNGQIVWDQVANLEKKFGIDAYPTGIFNTIAKLKHSPDNNTIIVDLAKEAVESYKANTSISAKSQLSGNSLKVDITVNARTKNNYKVNAWVLEDKVIQSQTTTEGIVKDFEHNHIGRYSLTDINGDQVSLENKSSKTISLSGTLPSDIKNISNAYLVIFITYSGNPEVKNVTQAEYKNFGTIVDNAFTLPLNGSLDIRYEE